MGQSCFGLSSLICGWGRLDLFLGVSWSCCNRGCAQWLHPASSRHPWGSQLIHSSWKAPQEDGSVPSAVISVSDLRFWMVCCQLACLWAPSPVCPSRETGQNWSSWQTMSSHSCCCGCQPCCYFGASIVHSGLFSFAIYFGMASLPKGRLYHGQGLVHDLCPGLHGDMSPSEGKKCESLKTRSSIQNCF